MRLDVGRIDRDRALDRVMAGQRLKHGQPDTPPAQADETVVERLVRP